ncbi:putative protein OS=Tsukamurella paurometabola (strain ATCC 8368 / DSM / CCUG 35730 /CIP 100753 / JCM 10117 / KCTC 9821 / NBRC 16120 / NCIMB 702349/ NCTC 13040) OX=521096 GN=Tpau_4222 PE=4 SV=1 [Tsukamurella paurometabola]|uniref:Uncharacterized protein n=1 Tax=Tsukamurella paurometabola (strain ATCC 8368 / DSM 20162 / CCUG 35730 / CIP 100753 / JCM 10117 / KCTC 9821 / NBRC 16120 / NCIMB 702349 / NCTC 13040) TaxID=521096 RepID=D5UP81_TSUPD|nr:hypothetical protein [Tsukamurella paurometabola]ADG80790.1 hypothetical protein Tpau_4222 [Tsukamurella paurometabola DSM 20162]SUP40997.1 Uncharacterised protein [Tsukamurella paurometabola]
MKRTIRIGGAAATVLALLSAIIAGGGTAAAAPQPDDTVIVDVTNTVFLVPTPPQRVKVYADGRIITNGDSPSGLVQLRGSRTDVADLRAIAEGVLRNRPAVDTTSKIFDGSAVNATVRTADGTVLRANLDNPEPRGWPALGNLTYDLRKRIFPIPGERAPYVEKR